MDVDAPLLIVTLLFVATSTEVRKSLILICNPRRIITKNNTTNWS